MIPLCSNGMPGHPERRSLYQAMRDLGWSVERRAAFMRKWQPKNSALFPTETVLRERTGEP